MKHMKKIMAAMLLSGAAMVPSTSHAFTSQATSTLSAAVNVTGGTAAMSVALFNVVGNTPATTIGWTGVAPGTSWTQAGQYVQITSTLTTNGAGIQTYTNNSAAQALPKYAGAVSTTTAAGLVNESTGLQTLPLAWQVVPDGKTPVVADDPNHTAPGQFGYAWFYYADKANGLLANAPGNFYIQIENAGSPPQIQFAQSTFGAGSPNGVNNVYLESNFQNALGGTTYGSNTITIELYTL